MQIHFQENWIRIQPKIEKLHLKKNYIPIIMVYFFLPGPGSTFPEVDPVKWSGSGSETQLIGLHKDLQLNA